MKLRDLILHNFRLKLFSLVTAVLIWVAIHLAIKSQSEASHPASGTRTNQVER